MTPTNALVVKIMMYKVHELEDLISFIRQVKANGSLKINFSQGCPSGMIEWREGKDKSV